MSNQPEHPENEFPDDEFPDNEQPGDEFLEDEISEDDEPANDQYAAAAEKPARIPRRKVLQGLAGGAVVAGGLAVTANRVSGPVVETTGTSTPGAGATSTSAGGSATSVGGANPTLQVGDGQTPTSQAITGETLEGQPGVTTDQPGVTTDQSIIESSGITSTTTADPVISGQQSLRGANIAAAAPVAQRVLVIIELQGGSDGLSLVVPDDQRYRSARGSDLSITPTNYHAIDSEVGLHPGLALLSKRNVATVEGVGPIDGNLSHFKMAASWERGDVRSAKLVSSGFCGRVADAVNLTNGFAGVSVAGRTGFFAGGRVPALVMSEASELDVVTGTGEESFRAAARGFTNPIGANWVKLAEMGAKLRTGLANPPDNTMTRRGKELGEQLYLAAQLIKADIGVKVLYANLGSFDTHDNQERRLRFLWEEFDYAVDGFFSMLEAAGMGDRALVATTSEFGRRLKQNARGTDHGSASNLIMVGPIEARRYGAYPSLTNVDSDGNLKTEVPFDQYYATLCKDWMGVEPSLVLPGDPSPLGLT